MIEEKKGKEKILGKYPELRNALLLLLVYADRDGEIPIRYLNRVQPALDKYHRKMHPLAVEAVDRILSMCELLKKVPTEREARRAHRLNIRTWAKEQRVKFNFY